MEYESGTQHVPVLGRSRKVHPRGALATQPLTLHSSWSMRSWRRLTWSRHCLSASELCPGVEPVGGSGWAVSQDKLRGSGGAGIGGTALTSSASPPTHHSTAHLRKRSQETGWVTG